MSTELFQSIQKHSLILALFAIIVAVALGLVNAATRDSIIEQQEAAERAALEAVFPAQLHDNDLLESAFHLDPASTVFNNTALLGLTQPRSAYRGQLGNNISGVILPVVAPDGYSGSITLLVGITDDGVIQGVRVVNHRETPGLGDKIDLRISDWILGFNGRSLTNPEPDAWKVRKDGGEFDQFVGATVTPRAVVASVARALEFFHANHDKLVNNE
jgi:electron transport complex protein RnfG